MCFSIVIVFICSRLIPLGKSFRKVLPWDNLPPSGREFPLQTTTPREIFPYKIEVPKGKYEK